MMRKSQQANVKLTYIILLPWRNERW